MLVALIVVDMVRCLEMVKGVFWNGVSARVVSKSNVVTISRKALVVAESREASPPGGLVLW